MAAIANTTDDALPGVVALAIAGDEVAFARIVRAHHTDMTRVAFLVCGDLDLADEAVAAAWPIIWRKLGTLRDAHRLRAWLVSVAANEARRLARRRRRRTIMEIPVDDAVLGSAIDPGPRSRDLDLAAALEHLAPDDRALLSLRYVAGLTSTELARATGRSPSGTRVRLSRLLDRLRKELRDD